MLVGGVPSGPTLVGATVQLTASPVNANGVVVSNASVKWSSSDASIATVTNGGLVLAVGAGSVTITAAAGRGEGSATFDMRAGGTVSPLGGTLDMLDGAVTLTVPASALNQTVTILLRPATTAPSNARLVAGTAFELGPDNLAFLRASTLTMKYSASKVPSGVTENALQLYVASGSGWSLVAGSSVNATTKTVAGSILRAGTYAVVGTGVEKITLAGPIVAGALYVGQQGQLAASTYDAANNLLAGRVITWSTSDASRATVDANGFVSATAPGTVTITATSEGKSASTVITVLARVPGDWSQVTSDWTTFQGNANHTGYVPAIVDPSIFKQRWVDTLGAGQLPVNPVTFGPGVVYASNTGYFASAAIYALDLSTGVQRWTVAAGQNNSTMPPTYANGTVYMQTNDISSYLWAFDASSGTVRFRVGYSSQWSTYFAPVVVGSLIYMGCGTYDGVCAMETSDGKLAWFGSTNQYDGWTPAVANGLVYVYTGSYTPKLQVFDAATGAASFEIPDPHFSWNGWTMGVAPVLGASNDLVATQGGRLISFDLAGRKIGWEQTGKFSGNVAVANGSLYVFNNNQVEARSENDGTLSWVWIPPEGVPVGTMIVTRNLLFVSTAANTYAVDLSTHKQVWSHPLGGGRLALSSQGVLTIAGNSGKLAAITVK